MVSTNDKRHARELAAARGVKYTEALRAVLDDKRTCQQAAPAPTAAAMDMTILCLDHPSGGIVPTQFDLAQNLIIGGCPGTGATFTIRTLAAHGANQGWNVHHIHFNQDAHDPVRYAPLPGVVEHAPSVLNPAHVRHEEHLKWALANVRPGTPQRPTLLLIDDFLALPDTEGALAPWPGNGGWGNRLVRLMQDQHTGVVLRARAMWGEECQRWQKSSPIWGLAANRLHMGPADLDPRGFQETMTVAPGPAEIPEVERLAKTATDLAGRHRWGGLLRTPERLDWVFPAVDA